MSIKVESQPALLGLHTRYPKVNISHKDATIKHSGGESELAIKTDVGRIQVNCTAARQALNLYNYKPFMGIMSKDGLSMSNEGIAEIVQEGFQMMDIHENGVIIAELAEENAWPTPRQLDVKFKPGAQVNYAKGSVKIDAEITPLKFKITENNFSTDLEWGKIAGYIRQQAEINVEWVGSKVDFLG